MSEFGEGLVEAAEQALAIARGESDPKDYRVYVPRDVDVAAIRKRTRLTQAEFAKRYGIPIGTLRDLEQGRAQPDTSTRAYLTVIGRDPDTVFRLLSQEAAA